ncbi:MAG: SUMF1/EgtB/PvdO family nonheme iron enzyme [Planctomycetes bacterium]|nr:SUMF1/EgtB/PvdO family nonheme iron enzyme [Planctomycetota bacterium]
MIRLGVIPGHQELCEGLVDTRRRLLELVDDLDDAQLRVPLLATVNPILWELGHVAWFQERWCLREPHGAPPILAQADALYDSALIAHDTRWDLILPGRVETEAYLEHVLEATLTSIRGGDGSGRGAYGARLATFHEDMHGEALVMTRRTLGLPPPRVAGAHPPRGAPLTGDARVPGGKFRLGAEPGSPFTFDNEMWAHERAVAPFAIARAAVTQAEFARFVEDGGYARRELWSAAGWTWRTAEGATHPLHWRRAGSRWLRRHHDRLVALEPDVAMHHVAWFEAEAWCAWAGRRLPTELEWEVAATADSDGHGRLSGAKRVFPWGGAPPTPEHAQLDLRTDGPVPVSACPAGDSAFGLRQMLGNVWEWTADDFGPYPGFEPGPYREYSQPWFTGHKVLRGGSFATRARLASPTYRNFYTPDRRDVLAGFRTCARDA